MVTEVDAATASKGGMIALLPADPAALVVDHELADPADDLHVTLAYLGSDVSGWDEMRRAQIAAAARAAAAPLPGPVEARVMGHATFNPDGGPDGDRDPCAVYLIGDCAELAPLRARLYVELVALLGPDLHPPHEPTVYHLTAGYGLTAADLTYTGPVVFDRLLVRLAGADTVLPLDPTGERHHGRLLREDLARHADHGHDDVRLAILTARDSTWQTNHRDLSAAVSAFTTTAPAAAIRAAIDPTAPRARRKAQAGLALATALHQSGHADAWITANQECRTRAWETGARCGAHQLTNGALPVDTELPAEAAPAAPVGEKRRGLLAVAAAAAAALLAALIRRRRNQTAAQPPTQDLDQQIDGLAGDLADLYTAARAADDPDDPDGGVTDDDVEDALDAAAGVAAYADMAWGTAFLDGATALYADAGAAQVNWLCCLPGCVLCQDVMANSPYPVDAAPGPQHPRCDDWVEPLDPAVDVPAAA